jgi:hypothetical protein
LLLKEDISARNLNEVGLGSHQCVGKLIQEFCRNGGIRMTKRNPKEVGPPFGLRNDKVSKG